MRAKNRSIQSLKEKQNMDCLFVRDHTRSITLEKICLLLSALRTRIIFASVTGTVLVRPRTNEKKTVHFHFSEDILHASRTV